MNKIFTDRSRIETFQRCNRKRFLEYHASGTGLAPARKNLALCVGGSVHVGLEVLLREGEIAIRDNASPHVFDVHKAERWTLIEELAVSAALADFASHSGAL